jgi:hypothetical protein
MSRRFLRCISLVILTLLLLITGTAPASQAGTESPDVNFTSLLNSYVHAYKSGNTLQHTVFAHRIKRSVFSAPGTSDYIQKLQYIDALTNIAPEAVQDLAVILQLHWEAQYGYALKKAQTSNVHTGTMIGAAAGLSLLGAAVFLKPATAPKYFKVIRHLMPITGLLSGHHGTHALHRQGLLSPHTPISPAHVMRLGLNTTKPHEDDPLDEDEMFEILAPIMAGAGAGSMAYEIMKLIQITKWSNAAATPFKIHPVILVGSLAIGLIVEKGAEAGINACELNGLRARLQASINAVDSALAEKNDSALLIAADSLVRATTELANYLNLTAPKENSEPQAYLIRSYLKSYGPDSTKDLSLSAQAKAAKYVQGFPRWLMVQKNNEQQNVEDEARKQLFRQYLERIDRAQDKKLAKDLRERRLKKSGAGVLFQASALLRATGNDLVTYQADALITMALKDLQTEAFSGDTP